MSQPMMPLAFHATALPLHPSRSASTSPKIMACATTAPVLVCDVLGTLVRDPFYHDMASYFGFDNLAQFVAAKTPRVWVDFELGRVDETYLARHFFKDHRPVNLDHLKHYLKQSYQLLPGVPKMLTGLRDAQVQVHLCTNYPTWASLIEDSLHLTSRFGVKWTFVSGAEGVRKPDKEAYWTVAHRANVNPSECILLDDRQENCKGALDAGFLASVCFENAFQASEEIGQLYLDNNIPLQL